MAVDQKCDGFYHKDFGPCEWRKGGKVFVSLYDNLTHIHSPTSDSPKIRPLVTSPTDVSAGSHATRQSLRGECLSFGINHHNRKFWWNNLVERNTFLSLCQLLGEVMWLEAQGFADKEDLKLKEKLKKFIQLEADQVKEGKDVKTTHPSN